MFALHAIHEQEVVYSEGIDYAIDEIRRIERMLTTFREDSVTAEINRNAGVRPVEVDYTYNFVNYELSVYRGNFRSVF